MDQAPNDHAGAHPQVAGAGRAGGHTGKRRRPARDKAVEVMARHGIDMASWPQPTRGATRSAPPGWRWPTPTARARRGCSGGWPRPCGAGPCCCIRRRRPGRRGDGVRVRVGPRAGRGPVHLAAPCRPRRSSWRAAACAPGRVGGGVPPVVAARVRRCRCTGGWSMRSAGAGRPRRTGAGPPARRERRCRRARVRGEEQLAARARGRPMSTNRARSAAAGAVRARVRDGAAAAGGRPERRRRRAAAARWRRARARQVRPARPGSIIVDRADLRSARHRRRAIAAAAGSAERPLIRRRMRKPRSGASA